MWEKMKPGVAATGFLKEIRLDELTEFLAKTRLLMFV
jgi:hypothetical protein